MDLLHFSNDYTLHCFLDNLVMGGVGVGVAEGEGVDTETRTFDTVIKILELIVIVVGIIFKLVNDFQQ